MGAPEVVAAGLYAAMMASTAHLLVAKTVTQGAPEAAPAGVRLTVRVCAVTARLESSATAMETAALRIALLDRTARSSRELL